MATGDSGFTSGFSKAFGVTIKGVPDENQRTAEEKRRSKTAEASRNSKVAGGGNRSKSAG